MPGVIEMNRDVNITILVRGRTGNEYDDYSWSATITRTRLMDAFVKALDELPYQDRIERMEAETLARKFSDAFRQAQRE